MEEEKLCQVQIQAISELQLLEKRIKGGHCLLLRFGIPQGLWPEWLLASFSKASAGVSAPLFHSDWLTFSFDSWLKSLAALRIIGGP